MTALWWFRFRVAFRLLELRDRLARWIAYSLPDRVVYWAAIRLIAYAQSHRWSRMGDQTVAEIMARWKSRMDV